jgi:integrase
LAYRFEGKQKTLAFGGYPKVTLAAARGLRDEAKAELSHGRDPGAPRPAPVNLDATFERVATRWFDARKSKWTPGHAARVWSRVEYDLNKALGDRPLLDIQKADLLSALRAIENREGAPIETARRVKGYASDIFDFGKAEGIVDRNLVLELQGALSSPRPVRHRASVKPSELPAFLSSLRAYAGERRTALALRLILNTFVRTSELRFATWDEFEGLDALVIHRWLSGLAAIFLWASFTGESSAPGPDIEREYRASPGSRY